MLATEKSAQVDLVTVTEAARIFGRTRGMVHYFRLAGRLPAITVEGRYLIPRESVEALQRERAAVLAAPKTTGS
jgi:hypothetical protein